MGWDADAVLPTIHWDTSDGQLPAEELEFFRLAAEVLRREGIFAYQLETASLGGSFRGILEHATKIKDYDPSSPGGLLIWSPEIVQRAQQVARWDFRTDDELGDLVPEVRLFLEVCASRKLAIAFSW